MAVLDSEVEVRRSALKVQSDPAFMAETEPYPAPVDGGELLHDTIGVVQRFVVLDGNEAIAIALWIALAHAHDAATHSPILALESPEKRCGKSTLLSVIASLVPKPLPFANITMASLFRTIDKYGPTFLVDEADTFINSDELRGVLNSGHYRPMANVVRTVGEDYELKIFSTWAPKVIALIGGLPDTLQDRAIVLRLRRKLPSEHVERFRGEALAECQLLNAKLARWTQDHGAALKGRDPEVPSGLNDRAADNWCLPLALADEAGGDWPAMARTAALALSGEVADEGGASITTKLLADIRTVFDEANVGLMPSHSLADKLAEREDAPWGEWFHGKPITPRAVARLLKRFDIKPRKERASNVYWCQDFEDAWGRYLDEPA